MIQYKTGSIFDSTAECLVNPINCVGVMGAGLALEFKQRYPDMMTWYKKACANGDLHIGQVAFWTSAVSMTQCICMFPTKYHYADRSTVAIIDIGLKKFIEYAPVMKIKSVAFPKVGCGLGGLNFELQVQPLLELYFSKLPELDVEIYI